MRWIIEFARVLLESLLPWLVSTPRKRAADQADAKTSLEHVETVDDSTLVDRFVVTARELRTDPDPLCESNKAP